MSRPSVHFLVAGLGNEGGSYTYTRHNVGYLIVQQLPLLLTQKFPESRRVFQDSNSNRIAKGEWQTDFARDGQSGGEIWQGTVQVDGMPFMRAGAPARASAFDLSLTLLRPSRFMNLSGNAVGMALSHHFGPLKKPVKLTPLLYPHLIVIHDDMAIKEGKVALKTEGTSNHGHRGIISIAERLQTVHFPRLRIGIGRPAHVTRDPADVREYVLGPMSDELISACQMPDRTDVEGRGSTSNNTLRPGSLLTQSLDHILNLAGRYQQHLLENP